jgi:hypothetical protein
MARYSSPLTSPLTSSTYSSPQSLYYNDRERDRVREKKYNSSGGYDNQLQRYSPFVDNSLTSIAPGYGFGSPHTNQGAMIRGGGGQSVIEEPVVEHEHHHVHHHIDHGRPFVVSRVLDC